MTTAATIKSVLTLDTSNYESGIKKAKSQASGFEDTMKMIGGKMRTIGIGMSAALTAPIILASKELLKLGNEFEGIQAGYENFANIAGVASDEFLDSMIKSSKGTLAQRDAMLSFNQAAGLVSTDFAKTLPDAMDTFMKVAAATGQTATKVLSDYVTGVGRGSKMILDNLGITVDLTKANEDYAKKLGIAVDELTGEQQKLALNEQAMALLTEKYAGMADITDSNAVKSQQFQATMQNLKDTVGVFLTDAITPFIEKLNTLAQEYLPKVEEWLGKLNPKQKEMIVIVLGLVAVLGPLLVILGTLVTAIGAIGAPVIAVIAVLGLLAAAWTTNFGGIRDKLTEVWNRIKPIFERLSDWLKVVIPAAIQKLKDFWMNVLYPKILFFWLWLKAYIFPALENLGKFFGAIIYKAVQALVGLWQNVLFPALSKLWDWFKEKILPILKKVNDWLSDKLKPAFQGISNAIAGVSDWLGRMADKIMNIKLPDWLTPGSPTPFEMGLRGINNQLRTLDSMNPFMFEGGFKGTPQPAYASASSNDAILNNIEMMIRNLPEDIKRGNRDLVEKLARRR